MAFVRIQLMNRVLNLAVYPCEYLERSPLPRGFLPRIGKGKALKYLYPDEDRKLLACVGTEDKPGVPFVDRLRLRTSMLPELPAREATGAGSNVPACA